ncbi:hypothetical protein ID866_4973 [Astraeus odoratus]|nr:hypothetical protein ID866_4973 [Astraeus odoratus]
MSSTGRGFQISYPTITLHAISRAEGLGPSIYCQLDEGENEASEDADVTGMRELTITPRLPDSLEPIFEALSLCASLHPDPCMSEDGDDDDAFLSADHFEPFAGGEEEELSEVGRAALEHLESIIYDPFQRSNDINGDSEEQERDYREDEARS